MQQTNAKLDKGFKGNLDTVSLLDVFQLLFSGKKTGMLEVVNEETSKRIYLKSGMIVAADSNEEEDLLGNLLLKRGKIKKIDLNRALSMHRSSGKKIGQVFIELGLFTDAEICNCLRLQVEEIIYGLFAWRSGEFVFHEGRVPHEGGYEVALNPMNVIMEATRRLDEWNEMKENLPSDNHVLYGSPPDELEDREIRLSREEFSLLTLIDGKKTFKQIIGESLTDRFTTSRAIHRLISMGLVKSYRSDAGGFDSDVAIESVLRDLVKFHKGIHQVVSEIFTEFMGEGGKNIMERIFKNCKAEFAVLDRFSGSGGKSMNYDTLVSEAMALPEKAVLHKVSNSFYGLSMHYLYAVREYLGRRIFNEAMGRLRKRSSREMESRRQMLINFGLEDEVFRLLHLK
jgi:hypothetical protein